ncbi:hypothetical protein [Bradyrhizobium sp. RDM12]
MADPAVDDEDTHDEDGRLLIRRPVQPGPRPAPTALTPEIEAGAAKPIPQAAGLISPNVSPRRPTMPSKPAAFEEPSMNTTDYTMDPRNAVAVGYLRSRPMQIGTAGFVISIAMHLENTGALSKAQRDFLEGIAASRNGRCLTRCRRRSTTAASVFAYFTPGCHPAGDFMTALGERYKPLGKRGIRCVHDPIYMSLLDPANVHNGTPHCSLTSCGVYHSPERARVPGQPHPRHAESAETLNDVVSPSSSTPDSLYAFRSVRVGSTWWCSASAVCAKPPMSQPDIPRLTSAPLHLLVSIARGAVLRRYDRNSSFCLIRPPGASDEFEILRKRSCASPAHVDPARVRRAHRPVRLARVCRWVRLAGGERNCGEIRQTQKSIVTLPG